MRNKSLLLLLIVLTMFGGGSSLIYGQSRKKDTETKQSRRNEKGKTQLFNGKDLSNWSFFLKDPAVDPATVFTVQNGVIHIKGDPFGYMRTRDTYSEYKLHVEWRYPVEASNSGVFIHAQLPDTIWLKNI